MIIDFHSHILPRVDHGSQTSATSIKQLEMMVQGGTELSVATSHFYPHMHEIDEYIESVDKAVQRLEQRTASLDIGLKVALGAEVLACEGIDKMPNIDKLCIRGTRCMLLEMPWSGSWNNFLISSVKNLIDSDYKIVLAHIDRYIDYYSDEIDDLLSHGAVAQINAVALASGKSRKRLMPYIEEDFVFALGSDLHGAEKRAYRDFANMRKRLGDEVFGSIMSKTEALLQGAELLQF